MNAIGLKYLGKREEGISVMLFRSYKTVRINKFQPYRFTSRDIVTPEAINYYKKLANLGLAIATSENDFLVGSNRRVEVRREPLAAETDVQIDPTQKPKMVEDQMADDISKVVETPADVSVTPTDVVDGSDTEEEVVVTDENKEDESTTPVVTTSEDFAVDKSILRDMSPEEISEYLEMNLSKDQLKALINELGLDISVGRKGVPTLVGEIVATADLDSLTRYLSK